MKIGFVSNFWGTARGHSYVSRELVNILKSAGHETHMYRIGDNQILTEFPEVTSLKTNPTIKISKEDFEKWLDEINPDYCMFNEYIQWWDEDHDKLEICKERGIKTIGYLVWEKLDWDKIEHYKLYTKIICPTVFQTKLLRQHGLYNSVHTPWGIDLTETEKITEPEKKDNKVIFYHCAGAGGVDNRKNTSAIIEAYKTIEDKNTDLMITHLNKKQFSRKEIFAFTKYADIVINVSKWDTIGLNTIESNALGRPVIVANAPPMNELIKDRVNGFVVDGKFTKSPNVTCPSYEIDVVELAKKMTICKQKAIVDTLKNNSKKFAETNFDMNKNKKYILELFKEA